MSMGASLTAAKPSFARCPGFKSCKPETTGSHKIKRAAATRLKPTNRPLVLAMQELETFGVRARLGQGL